MHEIIFFCNKMIAVIMFFIATLITAPQTTLASSEGSETADKNLWRSAGRFAGLLFQSCLNLTHVLAIQNCLFDKSIRLLDTSMNRDVIELSDGVSLVRKANETNLRTAEENQDSNDWKRHIFRRFGDLFKTHILEIRFGESYGKHEDKHGKIIPNEARRKQRRGMLMPIMMFGIIAISAIMIPMGFQFLAVLGGKALLLAKMALLLTSIQGLKKIATSNVNYGLYSTPHATNPWHYDRQWPYDSGHENVDFFPGLNYYDVPDQHHADLLHTNFRPGYESTGTYKKKYYTSDEY